MYIYKTTNILTDKFYVGKRVYRKKDDDWYLGSGIYLKRAIEKYGRENFKKEILEWCNSIEELNQKEIFWIKQLNSTNIEIGYNIALGGQGGNLGEESCKKISNKLKGIKRSEEFKKKVSKALKGKIKTSEHIEKLKQSLLGRKRPAEVTQKMSNSMKEKYDLGWSSPVQIQVHQYDKNTGNFIQSFDSATKAGEILSIGRKGITNNCQNKSKSSGGFRWSKNKKENINE